MGGVRRRRREEEADGSTQPKTRTPHKGVGKNLLIIETGFMRAHLKSYQGRRLALGPSSPDEGLKRDIAPKWPFDGDYYDDQSSKSGAVNERKPTIFLW